ncbi:MAG: transposase [Sulfuriferula sp.]
MTSDFPIRRRIHTAEFKTRLVSLCQQPGVSVAAVALAHGLNVTIYCGAGSSGLRVQPMRRSQLQPSLPALVPVQVTNY